MTAAPGGFDWRHLIVEGDTRSAIYDERFPGRLADALAACPDPDTAAVGFTETFALGLLATFAGTWETLGADDRGRRYVYRALPDDPDAVGVFWFRAVEPAPGFVVVASVQFVPRP